jgi:hypothetical protein
MSVGDVARFVVNPCGTEVLVRLSGYNAAGQEVFASMALALCEGLVEVPTGYTWRWPQGSGDIELEVRRWRNNKGAGPTSDRITLLDDGA